MTKCVEAVLFVFISKCTHVLPFYFFSEYFPVVLEIVIMFHPHSHVGTVQGKEHRDTSR